VVTTRNLLAFRGICISLFNIKRISDSVLTSIIPSVVIQ